MTKSRASLVDTSVDLEAPGRQNGDIRVQWSDNTIPLGFHPVPIVTVANGRGPTALLMAGVHGDEFEGPCALLRLAQSMRADRIAGRVIIIPALNLPAVSVSSRTSPLDHANLNRVFPGQPAGSITQLIADYVETELVAKADVVIDLHSGGKAYVFAPCTLVSRAAKTDVVESSLELAEWFGLPTLWLLGDHNDDRSVNSAADRVGKPMIALELGGGGGCDPDLVDKAVRGLNNCLHGLGILPDDHQGRWVAGSVIDRVVEISDRSHSVFSPGRGLFERFASAGCYVDAGDEAGVLYRLEEPEQPPVRMFFENAGFVLAHINRGMVNRGELLYSVTTDVSFDSVPALRSVRNVPGTGDNCRPPSA